jgi:hypothetical protein
VTLIRERLWNNGSDRVSHHIKRRPAVNVHHAERYSRVIGLALNRFVTINFTHTTCEAARVSRIFRKLLTQRFAPWLRRAKKSRRVIPPTYIWTMEAAGGQVAIHWLVHIPRGLRQAFERKLAEWLAALTGAEPGPQAIRIKPIYNPVGLRRYILKGTEPIWAAHLNVTHVDQGVTIGKRSGFSENLGPTARKRGGYKPKRMRPCAKAA